MSLISSKYELEYQENFEKLLIALGVPGEMAHQVGQSKTIVHITLEGTRLTMVYPAKPHRAEIKNIINLGQEDVVTTPLGKHKVNFSQDGNTFKGTIKVAEHTMNCSFIFSDYGFVDTVTVGDITAMRRYKRI